MMLQIGWVKSQTNWKYSDNFSANCMGNFKNTQALNEFISIQNDSIIVANSFEFQCCPQFAMMISDIQNDSIYVTFQDTSKYICTCTCTFHSRLNIGKYTSDKLKINLNGIWYSIGEQDFAPIGTEWYYTERFAFSGDINYLKISSKRDTTISGKLCRVIQKERNLLCNNRPEIEYMYEENSILYFWDEAFNRFQVLYDFNKTVNDYWIIEVNDTWTNTLDTIKVVVDSISSMTINNQSFKVLYVTYNSLSKRYPYSYTSKIIEKIGDTSFLFNFYPESSLICDANFSGGLRCYNDPTRGNYSTGIAESCTYLHIWNGLNESISNININVFPNPGDGLFEVHSNSNQTLTAEVKDITGRLIVTKEFDSHILIDLTNYPNGLYLLTIIEKAKKIGWKKLIKK